MRTRSPLCVVDDALHRRAEVGDVEAAAQAVGQRRAQELDDEVLALLADVDADLVVRQLDDDAAGAVGAAAEVDVAQRQLACGCRLSAKRGRSAPLRARQRAPARCCRARRQHLALDLRAVAGRLLEVQHQARALAGLGDADRAQVALVDLDASTCRGRWSTPGRSSAMRGGVCTVKPAGTAVSGFAQLDADDFGAGLLRAVDRLDRVLRQAGSAAPASTARAQEVASAS